MKKRSHPGFKPDRFRYAAAFFIKRFSFVEYDDGVVNCQINASVLGMTRLRDIIQVVGGGYGTVFPSPCCHNIPSNSKRKYFFIFQYHFMKNIPILRNIRSYTGGRGGCRHKLPLLLANAFAKDKIFHPEGHPIYGIYFYFSKPIMIFENLLRSAIPCLTLPWYTENGGSAAFRQVSRTPRP